ncbi:MAG: hypothetical protein ACK5MI_06110 [Mangrovibacterium sp.]
MNSELEALEQKELVVSLTSFPAAIPFAVQAIQSILNGSIMPAKVILYLTASQFLEEIIPDELKELEENSILQVRFYEENIRSYTKLIPALNDFPEAVIVTIDDDIYYGQHMLRDLLRLHAKHPNAIIGHRVRDLKLDAPYRQWERYKSWRYLTKNLSPKFGNVQTGVGGVLYPPHSLNKKMLDSKIFMEMAPTVDDIWFWAAAVANGTKIAPVPHGDNKPRDLRKPSQISLKKTNIGSKKDVNRIVLEAILEQYPVIKQRIGHEINTKECLF